MDNNFGKLYIVSTPIGNLKDMTFRAVEVLKEVDLIAAEDTRHTRELLNHFNIDNKLISYHEHNKYEKTTEIIDLLKSGLNVALVTDAGTPIISDPGNELVKEVSSNDIEITAIPGACAAINALVLSGMDARTFLFIGFLSNDNKLRKMQLSDLLNETRTMIFYISPHDLIKDLKLIIQTFGEDRNASLSREMTKIYEETVRGSLKEILEYFENKKVMGEFVLVVEGISKDILKQSDIDKWQSISIEEHLKIYLNEGLPEKEAIKKLAKDRNIDKREAYKILKSK